MNSWLSSIYNHIDFLFTLSDTQLFFFNKIILFVLWFLIGIYLYQYSSNFKYLVNNFNLFEFVILVYSFVFMLKLGALMLEYYLDIPEFSLIHYVTDNSSSDTNNSPTQNTLNHAITKTGDTAIITTALVVSGKVAQSVPSTTGKAAVLAGGVILGEAAINVKNVASKVSTDFLNKKKKIISNISGTLDSIFYSTGNNALDLINLIQVFNKLSLMFHLIIIYNFIITKLNFELMESFLLKIFPKIIVNAYIRSLKNLKKSSSILIIVSFLLL